MNAKNQKNWIINIVLTKKVVLLHLEQMAIRWQMPPDVRESGASPELYLQL